MEELAAHISCISRQYSPLDISKLPSPVSNCLASDPCSNHPCLEDFKIFQILDNRKITSGVKGDLHPKIVKGCSVELAHPVGVLFRDAVHHHQWTTIWKMEHQLMINKIPVPKNKDDLRNLGLSPFFSKCLEWVLVQWLWPVVAKFVSFD